MTEPRTLYRSVSLPELADILRTGRITGGGNRFNEADRRPLVLFADILDPYTLGHGEHAYRQAYRALDGTPAFLACEEAEAKIARHGELILARLSRDGIWCDPENALSLPFGEGYGRVRHAALRRPNLRRKYQGLFNQLKRLKREGAQLRGELDRDIERLRAAILAERATLPITSAVIVTRPLHGGAMFTVGGRREYGFERGSLQLTDIASIILVKHGQPLATVDVPDCGEPANLNGAPGSFARP
jgi:hypothetical protein